MNNTKNTSIFLIQPIESERLIIRTLRMSDLQDCFALTSDAHVMSKTVALTKHTSLNECSDYLKQIIDAYEHNNAAWWAVTEKNTDRVIGFCGYVNYAPHFNRAELGYLIAYEQWNKGYGTEACKAVIKYGFMGMQLHRVEATVDTENSASIRVLEKLGMQREGLLRERVLCNGEYRDRYMYGLLVSDCF